LELLGKRLSILSIIDQEVKYRVAADKICGWQPVGEYRQGQSNLASCVGWLPSAACVQSQCKAEFSHLVQRAKATLNSLESNDTGNHSEKLLWDL